MTVKIKLIKACSILLAAALITGCSSTTAKKDNNEQTETGKERGDIIEKPEAGLIFNVPKKYQDKGIVVNDAFDDGKGHIITGITWYYKPVTDKLFKEMENIPKEEFTEEIQQDFFNKMVIHSKTLLEITLVEEKEYKEKKTENWAGAEELGTNGGYMYLTSVPENNTDGMEEEEKTQYNECMDYIKTIKESLEFTEIKEKQGLGNKMPAFKTKDINGNEVTESIFKEKDLTVVNIWGTFCSPCIEEMPELGEWAKEMPDNVQIVGLVCDIEGDDDETHKELAKTIMEKANADFVQIIANNDLSSITNWVTGVPTTIFVDKDCNITGEPIIGANVGAYKKFVEDYLNGK